MQHLKKRAIIKGSLVFIFYHSHNLFSYWQCKHPFTPNTICATPGDGRPECEGTFSDGIFIADDEKTVENFTYWLITGLFFLGVILIGMILFSCLLYLLMRGKFDIKSALKVKPTHQTSYNVKFPIFNENGQFTSR